MKNPIIRYFKPDKPGITWTAEGCRIAAVCTDEAENGVILYPPRGKAVRIPFTEAGRQGSLCGMELAGEGLSDCSYRLYSGETVYTDPYAHAVSGLQRFGEHKSMGRETRGLLKRYDFDWEGDVNPCIPYDETILYGLHVRAFTKHKSSHVAHPGTFEGIVEKIGYLKELGVTALELMPCYEFDETQIKPLYSEAAASTDEDGRNTGSGKRVNCWGFQKGYYFAPKAAYSAGVPEASFKTMVRELHKAGLEVLMHFYFPEDIPQAFMLDVLKFWTIEYHVDGFRISGFHIPYRLLIEEPVLKRSKLWFVSVPQEELPVTERAVFKNIAVDNGNFRNDMRRFLKGDEGLVNEFIRYQKCNPKTYGVVNYLCDYDGFCLMDLVSYDRKHNEANGENNSDGTDYNYSWNCGFEGNTKKKGILSLRKRQIKNALAFLMLSQGTPFLFSGDEFGNSRRGNNNAYCQDNEIFCVEWKEDTQLFEELVTFIKSLIAFRKRNKILHMKEELKVMDSIGCGYPDISYHGQEAWRPDLGYVSRLINIFLCGKYAGEKEPFLYIACNMHWEAHELALPKLPKNLVWKKVLSTEEEELASQDESVQDGKQQVQKGRKRNVQPSYRLGQNRIGGRSICVYQTEEVL